MPEPLRRLHIPEPCTADWDAMRGDAKRRFCGSCSKHVHDLSAMTRPEARRVLDQGSVCVRFQQDQAGNVLHAPAARTTRLARAVALGAALLGAGPALAAPAVPPPSDEPTTESAAEPGLLDRLLARLRAVMGEEEEIVSQGEVLMGDVASPPPPEPPPTMGAVAPEPPPPPPRPREKLMGKVALPPPVEMGQVALPPPLPELAPGETVIPEVEEAIRGGR
jgi:hypothetical protein